MLPAQIILTTALLLGGSVQCSSHDQSNVTLLLLGGVDPLTDIVSHRYNVDELGLFNSASVLTSDNSNCPKTKQFYNFGPRLSKPQIQAAVQRKTFLLNNSSRVLPHHQLYIPLQTYTVGEVIQEIVYNNESTLNPAMILNYLTQYSFNMIHSLIAKDASFYPEVLLQLEFHVKNMFTKHHSSFSPNDIDDVGFNLFPFPQLLDTIEAALSFVHEMGWRRVALIREKTQGTRFGNMQKHLREWANFKANCTKPSSSCSRALHEGGNLSSLGDESDRQMYPFDETGCRNGAQEPAFLRILDQLTVYEFDLSASQSPAHVINMLYSEELRIFVFAGQIHSYFTLLLAAHQRLMYGMGFAWISVYHHLAFPEHYNISTLLNEFSVEDRERVIEALSGTLTIGPSGGQGPQMSEYLDSLKEWTQENGELYPLQQTAYAWDAVETVAWITQYAILEKSYRLGIPADSVTVDPVDLVTVWSNALENISFDGLTGPVAFTFAGVRTSLAFTIKNFIPRNVVDYCSNGTLPFTDGNASFPWLVESRGKVTTSISGVRLVFLDCVGSEVNSSTFVFGDGVRWIPLDGPGEIVTLERKTRTAVAIGYWAICIVVLLLHLFFVHRLDNQALLYDNSWIYGMEDISFTKRRGFLELFQIPNCNNGCGVGKTSREEVKFEKEGLLKNQKVFLKAIPIKKEDLSLKLRAEILQIRGLKHINVCAFVGCIFEEHTSIQLTEFCSKKSLYDVLANSALQLNWMFRLNFSADASRGLRYLHSKKILHTRLTMKNCVIDNRWRLKLTDFALEEFHTGRRGSKKSLLSKKSVHKMADTMKFSAPEVKLLGNKPSMASDVYSLGMVYTGIACRSFFMAHKDDKFLSGPTNTFDKEVPFAFIELIAECTSNSPPLRPTADAVHERLRKLDPKKSMVTDTAVLSLLETYSKSLEDLVEERNDWVNLEKKRMKNAHYCCVPASLTEVLQKGGTIESREFPSASALVFEFSPNALENSIPITTEVPDFVELVDNLHHIFDAVIERYNVHRVHQGGNSYILVSGVHNNEDVPPSELCKVALHMMCEAVKTIPLLELRPAITVKAGLHTGALLCGVIGQTHPIYSVYGSCIEVAMTLALNGTASEVHISEQMKQSISDTKKLTTKERKRIKFSDKECLVAYKMTCTALKKASLASRQH